MIAQTPDKGGVLAHGFGDDVAGAFEGCLHIRHVVLDVGGCQRLRIGAAVGPDGIGSG